MARLLASALLAFGLLVAAGYTSGAPTAPPRDHHRTWSVYNGGPEAIKYSALDQVNRTNVHRLAVAWTYRSGDTRPPGTTGVGFSSLQINPVIVRDTLYGMSQNNKVFALEASTGKPRWVHR